MPTQTQVLKSDGENHTEPVWTNTVDQFWEILKILILPNVRCQMSNIKWQMPNHSNVKCQK